MKSGAIEVIYRVKAKGKKKTVRKLYLAIPQEELEEVLRALPPQASKQKQIIEYMNDAAPGGDGSCFSAP